MVAGGREGVREVGLMDMELLVLLVVLSSTQLPSISFSFVVVKPRQGVVNVSICVNLD